jgi:hypothetical protein
MVSLRQSGCSSTQLGMHLLHMPCLACYLVNEARAIGSSSESLGTLQNRQSTSSLLAIRECCSNLRMKCVSSNRFIMIIKTLTINQMMGTFVLIYFIYNTVLYLEYLEAQKSLYFLGIFVVGMSISVSIYLGSGSIRINLGNYCYSNFLHTYKQL